MMNAHVIQSAEEAKRDRIEKEWARSVGVKRYRGGKFCVQKLRGKSCVEAVRHCHCSPPGTDHPTMWTKRGKPFYFVSQPYHLSMQIIEDIAIFCRENELTFTIWPGPSFYNPGKVL